MDKKEIKELIDKHRKEHLLILKQSKEYKEQLSEILIKLESEDSDDLKDLYFKTESNIGWCVKYLRESEHCIEHLQQYLERDSIIEEEGFREIYNKLNEVRGQHYYNKLKRFDH